MALQALFDKISPPTPDQLGERLLALVDNGNPETDDDVMQVYGLIKKGANINLKDSLFQKTPLIWAALHCKPLLIKTLIEEHANLEEKDIYGDTALIVAAKNGCGTEDLIAAGTKLDEKDNGGYTALMHALLNNQMEAVNALIAAGASLNEKNDAGQTALILAASEKNGAQALTNLKTLIAAGANLDEQDNKGITALMLATCSQNLEVVKTLLAAGAKIDKKSEDGSTALICAASLGFEDILDDLLQAHAGLNEKAWQGTALIAAVLNGHDNIAMRLIDAGADISLRNNEDKTALDLARANKNLAIVRLLELRQKEIQAHETWVDAGMPLDKDMVVGQPLSFKKRKVTPT